MHCFKLLVTFATACSSAVVAHQRDEDEVVLVETTDPQMVSAIREARKTLDGFLVLASNPPAGTEEFKLKVMVKDGLASASG